MAGQDKLAYGVQGDFSKIEWYLDRHENKRPVKFGSVFLKGCNRMSLLYRYYVFSTVTGADHIYYMRSTGNSVTQKSLYPDIKELEDWAAFKHEDTRGVVEYYVQMAYRERQRPRTMISP